MCLSGLKTYQTGGALMALLFIILIFSSCEDDPSTPQQVVNPDDLRYEGLWHGSTSQTRLLSFQVENLDSVPVVAKCRVGYVTGDVFKQRFFNSSTGLSVISSRAFTIEFPDGGSLYGMFVSPELCRGQLVIADAYSGELTEHPFTMILSQNQTNIFSAAKVTYEIGGEQFEFVQDDNYYRPTWRNTQTGTGYLVTTGLRKLPTESASQIQLITISAGRIESKDDLLQLFSPGAKKYAINAMDGFEVSVLFPGEYFLEYNTSNYSGNQAGSSFEIVDFMEVSTSQEGNTLYKFSARFNCRIYRMEGWELLLTNGFFIGYIETGPLK